jgi:predicted short-subunit dehydrogenase-like oxidoreductase (DUF2520 family)
MGELERQPPPPREPTDLAIIGRGRLGKALARALRDGGLAVEGPLARGERPARARAVLLCVPDGELAAAASDLEPGPLVGHCSGASGLEPLAPHERFSLHPLISVTGAGADFSGAAAAIAASSQTGRAFALRLARLLEMIPIELSDEDRHAYHAAASIASNYLIALEAAAERLAASAGVDRAMLVPLVRQTVENWAALGPERALTGPVARGDEATVAAQRVAVAERAPELLGLFDELTAATRRLAGDSRAIATRRLAGDSRAVAV